jgi:hypothetical protein
LSRCIVSFRRTQVFKANIAKTANVASRTRESLNVIQDKIPSPTNAAIANAKRITSITGAQGRIRTFVPRKEGQIYSLLALTTHPPVQTSGPSRPQTANTPSHAQNEGGACSQTEPNRKTARRENSSHAKTLTWKNSLWSAVGKILLRHRAAQNTLRSETNLYS